MIFDATIMVGISALMTYAIVETLHHSEFFAAARARLEAIGGFAGGLFACPFCLSHWAAAWSALVGLYLMPPRDWIEGVCVWLVLWLGGRALANLLNDLAHGFVRTPK